jgi:hypothetical protein
MGTINEIFTPMEMRLFFGGLCLGISIGMWIGYKCAKHLTKTGDE